MIKEDKPKAIIIGAGLVGTNLAYYLSKNNINVTVFDSRAGNAMV